MLMPTRSREQQFTGSAINLEKAETEFDLVQLERPSSVFSGLSRARS
jgi:hypothetical protein